MVDNEIITVGIIDPFTKSIEIKAIENTSDSFRKILGGGVDFKRLTLSEFEEAIETLIGDDEDFWDSFSEGYGIINGINIAVHNSGILLKHPVVVIGSHEYTRCHGKIIISGADESWEDINFPYSLDFLRNIVRWA